MPTQLRRSYAGVVCAAAAAFLLVGCATETAVAPTMAITPTYHPTTPTPVSNADVEAAIDGFEQYIHRLNELDPRDQASIDAFLAITSGEQETAEREFIDMIVSKGWSIEGSVVARFITQEQVATPVHQVSLEACVDTSALHYLDESGAEHGPPNESRVQLLSVRMRKVEGQWLVDETSPREVGASSCD